MQYFLQKTTVSIYGVPFFYGICISNALSNAEAILIK